MADPNQLDRIFAALSDPTRRAIVQLLTEKEPLTTSEVGDRFPLTRWAVMKHLAVLREARLVQTFSQGRRRLHFLDRRALDAAGAWLPLGRASGPSRGRAAIPSQGWAPPRPTS